MLTLSLSLPFPGPKQTKQKTPPNNLHSCYPDSLIGNIPNLYYYAANNPSEATIAKRRSYANTISYLTPPAENAGLYKGLKELKELISSYQGLRETGRGQAICATIIETARQCNLDRDVTLPETDDEAAMSSMTTPDRDAVVGKVYSKLMEIESRLLPCGLHVVGEPPSATEAIATLVNIAEIDRPDVEPAPVPGLPGVLARSLGMNIEAIYAGNNRGDLETVTLNEEIKEACRSMVRAFVEDRLDANGKVSADSFAGFARRLGFQKSPWEQALSGTKFAKADKAQLQTAFGYLEGCLEQIVKDNELGALRQALAGGYVEPGPGGDPIRNPGVLPTGKNIHALDPQSIPTAAAVKSAEVVVERLLEAQRAEAGGAWPETVAVVLWGTDNIKTYGESLAQVMAMVGVRPVADALGRVNKLQVIPLEELGRPRVDVVVNCSGVFRDLFVNQMNLLDRAIKVKIDFFFFFFLERERERVGEIERASVFSFFFLFTHTFLSLLSFPLSLFPSLSSIPPPQPKKKHLRWPPSRTSPTSSTSSASTPSSRPRSSAPRCARRRRASLVTRRARTRPTSTSRSRTRAGRTSRSCRRCTSSASRSRSTRTGRAREERPTATRSRRR